MPTTFVYQGAGANKVGPFGSGGTVIQLPSTFGGNSANAIISGANVANLNSQSAYTVMAWAYQDADATSHSNGTIAMAGDNFHFKFNDTGYLGAEFRPGGSAATTTTISDNLDADYQYIKKGTWNHVATTWDGGDGAGGVCSIYVNGKLWATKAIGTSATTATNQKVRMLAKAANDDYLGGSVTDVKVFNTKLTTAQVQAMASKLYAPLDLIGPVSGNCQVWYKLSDANATRALDSCYGNDGEASALPGSCTKDYDTWSLKQVGSGSTNTHVMVSGGTWDLKSSSHLTFDGGNDRFTTSSFDFRTSATSYTVALWVNPNSITAGNQCFINQDGKFIFRQSNKKLECKPNNGTNIEIDNIFLQPDTWYHVAMTFNSDDNVVKLYKDGSLIHQDTDSTTDTTGAAIMYIGTLSDGSEDFQGEMSDIRLYDYALTDAQMESLFTGQLPITPTHWWKCDDGVGASSVVDSGTGRRNTTSAVVYDGTLDGATPVDPDYRFGIRAGTYGDFVFSGVSGARWEQPRGRLLRCGRYGSVYGTAGTLPDGVIINHNSGATWVIGNISDYQAAQGHRGGLPNPIWELVFDQTSVNFGMDGNNNWIENQVSGNTGGYFSLYHQGDLILGNKTQACTVTGTNWYFRVNQLYSNKGVRGFSTMYPTTTPPEIGWYMDYGDAPSNSEKQVYLNNLNIQYDWDLQSPLAGTPNLNQKIVVGYNPESMGANNKVTGMWDDTSDAYGFTTSGGAMEFAKFSIAGSSSSIDADGTGTRLTVEPGMRVKFNGNLTNSGTFAASGAQIHFTTNSIPRFAQASMPATPGVYGGNNDTQWWNYKNDTHKWPEFQNLGTLFLNQGGNIYSDLTIGSNTNHHTNFIMGGTDSAQFTSQHDHHFNNLKLGVSSDFIAGTKICSVWDTMTNIGGLHGVAGASFDGTDMRLIVSGLNASYNGASTATAQGYFDAWIRTTASAGTILHKCRSGTTADEIKLELVGGKPVARWLTNGTMPTLTGATSVNDGIWHHLAYIADGTDANTGHRYESLYVDGKLDATDTTYSGWMTATTSDIHYGANVDTVGGGYFAGDISRITIFSNVQNAASSANKRFIPTEADLRKMAFMNYETMSGTTTFQFSGAANCVQWYEFNKGANVNGTSAPPMAYDESGWPHVSGAGWVSGSTYNSTFQKDFWWGIGSSGPNNFTRDTSTLFFRGRTSSAWVDRLSVHKLYCATGASDVFRFTRFQDEGPISYYDTFSGGLGSISRSTVGNIGKSSSPWTYMRDGSHFEVDTNNDEVFGGVITYYYSTGTAGMLPKMKLSTLLANNSGPNHIEMGGDLDVGSINPNQTGSLKTNGYNLICDYFNPYGNATGSLVMDPGSELTFRSARSWGYYWPGDYDSFFDLQASGMAGANFRGADSGSDMFKFNNDVNIGHVTHGQGVYSGSFAISLWAYLPKHYSGTTSTENVGFFGGGGGGQTGGGVAAWIYQGIGDYGGIYWDIAGTVYAQRSSISSALVASDFGKLTHWVFILDRRAGNDPGEGIMKVWKNGVVNASGNVKTSGDAFIAVSSSKNLGAGTAGLDGAAKDATSDAFTIGDFRIFRGAQTGADGTLTDAQVATLYNNGKTLMDGSDTEYPDPTNSLGAKTWYKMDLDESNGLTSLVDSVSGSNATYSGYSGKTGFTTMSGSGVTVGKQEVGRGALPPGGATLINFWSSGTNDYIVGECVSGYPRNLVTKGKVIFY